VDGNGLFSKCARERVRARPTTACTPTRYALGGRARLASRFGCFASGVSLDAARAGEAERSKLHIMSIHRIIPNLQNVSIA